MTIETDIIEWALDRPGWQQSVLVSLANGEGFAEAHVEGLVDTILQPDSGQPNQEAKKISIRSSVIQQVQLTEISAVHGVNALVEDQTLRFGPTGMTVIYGDNGSGKSGYARLIKSMVSARHPASVLPNVFDKNPPTPEATLAYTVNDAEKQQHYPANPTAELLKMRFYDEHCGDEYLTKTSTISYRPSALVLLDGLIDVCDRVRRAIQARMTANQARTLNLNLPPQTTAGAFVVGLTARTTADKIDNATRLAPETSERLGEILREEARLATSDSEKERTRLTALAVQLTSVSDGLAGLIEDLGGNRTDERVRLKAVAAERRAAATVAAVKSFENEPLDGVGSETWRALWEAARQYSVTEVYHDHEFPVTEPGALCVFCQQPLVETARERLRRFESYMTDTTERDALAAERAFANTVSELRQLVIASSQRTAAIAALAGLDSKLAGATEALLAKLDERRDAILMHLIGDAGLPTPLPAVDVSAKIGGVAAALQQKAEATDVDEFRAAKARISKEKDELQANVRICESADALRAEVKRLQEVMSLQAGKNATDTSAITAKSSQLTRQHATKQILDRFTRETERLNLQKVTLEDLGGQKGQLNQRPGLLGASHQDATARAVLSEGEQTALGLAGFFTEAEFDESKSSIVFDDPVTSLDHVRRDRVAGRLAQLAKDRQVVVFTHDVAFVADLLKAIQHEDVPLTEWCVERRGDRPGVCAPTFPWKAKDIKKRIGDLDAELQRIKRDRINLGTTDYEKRVAAWAGDLSETWERSVVSEIVDQVFDRGKSEVRVMKFRIFSQITDEDRKDFDEGYACTSKWARRHDKALSTNYVAPEPGELLAELDRIRTWHKRIHGYQNS